MGKMGTDVFPCPFVIAGLDPAIHVMLSGTVL